MDRTRAHGHWVALDNLFARTLPAADRASARQAFPEHVDAVCDVCLQLAFDDSPAELRAAAIALKNVLARKWQSDEDPGRF